MILACINIYYDGFMKVILPTVSSLYIYSMSFRHAFIIFLSTSFLAQKYTLVSFTFPAWALESAISSRIPGSFLMGSRS